MAITAGQFIRDAYSSLIVAGAEEPIESVDMQLGLRYMNRMFARLSGIGLPTGFTEVDSTDDVLSIADTIEADTLSLFALLVAPHFLPGQDVPILVVNDSKEAKRSLAQQLVSVPQTTLPNTLPLGSGNECFSDQRFFPGPDQATLLDELNGALLLEDETGTP
ncbi:hypothetical protein KAR91_09145 [Candidatus Pacearchaeota archaeon]|nr:hypothetical protein [Candidatus Pacearchaeota archaeon]